MKHPPNPIKIAIQCAGGRNVAAELLEKHPLTLTRWVKTGRMPAEDIGPLCRAGGNRVAPAEILDFIEQSAAKSGEKVAA